MSELNITSLVWISLGLFGIGLIVMLIMKFLKKDTAIGSIAKNLKDGYYKKALTQALKFVNENPNDFMIKFYIGQAYEGLKQFPLAVQYYEKATIAATISDQNEVKAQIFLKIADIYRKMKKYSESLGYYVLVLDKEPNNPKALMSASEMLFEEKNYKKAKEYLDVLIKLKADNFRARFILAKANVHLNLLPEAAAHLEFIIANMKTKDDVMMANTNLLLADVYSAVKNYPKAIVILKSMLDNEDNFETVLSKLVEVYVKLNQIGEAVELANRNMANVSKEKEAEMLYLIGGAYFRGGEIFKAAQNWDKAYKINPSYKDLRSLVGRYSYLIQNPALEPIYSKSEAAFQSLALKVLKQPFIKQTVKMDTYWIFEGGDKSFVIYRRPFPITTTELIEVERVINRSFHTTTFVLFSLFGVTNDTGTSNTTYNSDKMELISDQDFIDRINSASSDNQGTNE